MPLPDLHTPPSLPQDQSLCYNMMGFMAPIRSSCDPSRIPGVWCVGAVSSHSPDVNVGVTSILPDSRPQHTHTALYFR